MKALAPLDDWVLHSAAVGAYASSHWPPQNAQNRSRRLRAGASTGPTFSAKPIPTALDP